MEKIHILLPVHDRKEETNKFIKNLKQQTYENYHLVLIDDGSTDGTAEMALAELPQTTVIKGQGKWWWGGSLHQGYKWLKEHKLPINDIVLIINDDVTFEPDFLQKAVALLSANPRTLFLAKSYSQETGEFLDGGTHVDLKYLRFEQNPEDGSKINCLSTRGLFFKVGDFLEIGGFHPVLVPHYGSDYEFTLRAHRKGFALKVPDELKVYLNEKTSWAQDRAQEPLWNFLKLFFSKRQPCNPFYRSIFVILVCPWTRIPRNILKVWKKAIWEVGHKIKVHLNLAKE